MPSDDERDADELADLEGPRWLPAKLDIVEQQEAEAVGDEEDHVHRMDGRCTLCEMEDADLDKDVAADIAKMFDTEEMLQRRMPHTMRFDHLRKRVNEIIDAAEDTKAGLRYAFKRPTMRSVRRHFRLHDKTTLRQTNNQIERFEAALRELENGACWTQSEDGGVKQPQKVATDLMFKYNTELQKLYLAAERLEKQRRDTMNAREKRHAGGASFSKNRYVMKSRGPR